MSGFVISVLPDGRYFISRLRIHGSALEEIFSALKHISGGNLSVFTYSAVLGKLIDRKSLTQNKYSEKGYRDQTLNLDGDLFLLKARFDSLHFNVFHLECCELSMNQTADSNSSIPSP